MFSSSALLADFIRFVSFRLGFMLSERAAKRLYSCIKGIPKTDKELFDYDRKIRRYALEEINKCRDNVLRGIKSAGFSNDEKLLNYLCLLKEDIEGIRDLIESSQDIEKGASAKGLIYLDLFLLTGCFALNEQTQSLLDGMRFNEVDEAQSILGTIRDNARKINRVLHVRHIALSITEKRFLVFLKGEYNDVYESIRDMAIIAYSSSEEKKGFLSLFKREKRCESLAGRVLGAIETLEARIGPEIRANQLYDEFKKLNPDIEVSPKDMDKALNILAKAGWIMYSNEPPRRVWTKIDKDRVLELAKDKHIQEKGLTLGELMNKTGWSEDYASCVLNYLEERGVARKAIDSDGTSRWFFPGL